MKTIFTACGLFFAPLLFAHPHVWIDVDVAPKTDTRGNIVALQERWTFDPIYAAMLLESVERTTSPARARELWQHLADNLITSLRDEHFYTATDAPLQADQNAALQREDGQLQLTVTLPLAEPARALRYQIFEREYFIEILHSARQPRAFPNGCKLAIMPAEPSPEHRAAAAALDRNEKSATPLGQFFAETGVMTCP